MDLTHKMQNKKYDGSTIIVIDENDIGDDVLDEPL